MNGSLDCVVAGLLLLIIVLSNPLFAAIGSLMTIPVAVVADFFFHDLIPYRLSLLGAFLIVLGFSGMNYAEYRLEKEKRVSEPDSEMMIAETKEQV